MLHLLNVRVRAAFIVLTLLPTSSVAVAPSSQIESLSFSALPETTRNALAMVARAEMAAHAEATSVLALRAAALTAEAAGTYLEAAVGVRALEAMDVPMHLVMSPRDQASVRRRLSDAARRVASASGSFRSLTDEVLAEAVRARDLENPVVTALLEALTRADGIAAAEDAVAAGLAFGSAASSALGVARGAAADARDVMATAETTAMEALVAARLPDFEAPFTLSGSSMAHLAIDAMKAAWQVEASAAQFDAILSRGTAVADAFGRSRDPVLAVDYWAMEAEAFRQLRSSADRRDNVAREAANEWGRLLSYIAYALTPPSWRGSSSADAAQDALVAAARTAAK